jgi:hypothetical protein
MTAMIDFKKETYEQGGFGMHLSEGECSNLSVPASQMFLIAAAEDVCRRVLSFLWGCPDDIYDLQHSVSSLIADLKDCQFDETEQCVATCIDEKKIEGRVTP